MRVLHTIPGVPRGGGGPTTAIYGMGRALRELAVEADIATSDADLWGNLSVPLAERFLAQGVPMYCFRSPVLRKYGVSPGLADWLRSHVCDYDLVHIHGVFAHAAVSAAAAAVRTDVPYIVRPCGELDAESLRKNRTLKHGYLHVVGWRILNHAAAIHVTSAAEKASLEELGLGVPVVTIPLGADLVTESDLPAYGEFRRQYSGLAGRQLILFLSRIHPDKGLDLLLQALRGVAESRDDFVLAIAGSGPPSFERQVRRWATDLGLNSRLMFLGFLDGRRKYAALRDADLFVLPSYHENFGVAVVEAMSMGVPVLISDRVAIHPDVSAYGAGLVTPCDIHDITEALRRLLDSESLRRRMGENGRRLGQEKFTWSRVGADLLKLYRSILAQRS